MKNIATFDFGTSETKCAVINSENKIIFSCGKAVKTKTENGFSQQDPNEWFEAFVKISKSMLNQISASEIDSIIFSGQMQDLILMDENAKPLCDAILYNDQRGAECLSEIPSETVKSIEAKTSNKLDGSIPLTKLLWLKKYKPTLLAKTHKIGISTKDFIIANLTGNFISDTTSLSTGGIYNIYKGEYIDEIKSLGLDVQILPEIKMPSDFCGMVSESVSKITGLSQKTKVYAGIGDAGATTFASGIKNAGELNINIGTSGWVASVSESTNENAFNLAYLKNNLFVNVVPLLNAGGVHKWLAQTLGEKGNEYEEIHNLIESSTAGSGDLLFLPYISGERFPVADPNVRGCYIGISSKTTKAEIARATLEGVAFSIKQALLELGVSPNKISIIGGGGKETAWNQIFADVLDSKVEVFQDSQYISCKAIASIVSQSNQTSESNVAIYEPNAKNAKIYQKSYERFVKIYPQVKNLF